MLVQVAVRVGRCRRVGGATGPDSPSDKEQPKHNAKDQLFLSGQTKHARTIVGEHRVNNH